MHPSASRTGTIFNAVLNAGGTVRKYGFLVNNIGSIGTIAAPVARPISAQASCRWRHSICRLNR